MFVKKSTYETAKAELMHYEECARIAQNNLAKMVAEKQYLLKELDSVKSELSKARQALHAIVKQDTPHRNATVGRMVRYAQAALNGTFGKRK